MQTIFVQIKCALGKAYEVATAIADEAETNHLHAVYSTSGAYDLIAQFHLSDDTDVGRFVNERVHVYPGIRDTYTIMALKAF